MTCDYVFFYEFMDITPPTALARVAIIEDEVLLLGLLTEFFGRSGRFQVVGAFPSGAEAIAQISMSPPDLIILDMQLPDMNGLTIIQAIRERVSILPKIVVLSNNTNPLLIKQLMRAGVRGILQKGVAAAELLAACDRILKGGLCLNLPEGDLADLAMAPLSDSTPQLTTREIEILDLVVRGQRSKEIAGTLNLSARTVEKHRENLMKKLGAHDTASLVRYAAKTGLLTFVGVSSTDQAGNPSVNISEDA